MQHIFWPVNSELSSLTALANVQWLMLQTACSTFFAVHGHVRAYAKKLSKSKQCHHCFYFTFGFCNREKIKHPVTPDPAPFQFQHTFTLEKSKREVFFGVAQEDVINNTSGLWSTDCAALTLTSPWRKNKPRLWKQPRWLREKHLHLNTNKSAFSPNSVGWFVLHALKKKKNH